MLRSLIIWRLVHVSSIVDCVRGIFGIYLKRLVFELRSPGTLYSAISRAELTASLRHR